MKKFTLPITLFDTKEIEFGAVAMISFDEENYKEAKQTLKDIKRKGYSEIVNDHMATLGELREGDYDCEDEPTTEEFEQSQTWGRNSLEEPIFYAVYGEIMVKVPFKHRDGYMQSFWGVTEEELDKFFRQEAGQERSF